MFLRILVRCAWAIRAPGLVQVIPSGLSW
jgi:hypothetical protein